MFPEPTQTVSEAVGGMLVGMTGCAVPCVVLLVLVGLLLAL